MYTKNIMYPGGTCKELVDGLWLRRIDCEVAIKMGFIWMDVTPQLDICDNKFDRILTTPDAMYKTHVCEPDTRVPNYSTNFQDALKVAKHMGLTEIPVLDRADDMCKWLCNEILEK